MSSRWISTSTSACGALGVDRGMHRLDQRALAHAARAPQQRVVGGQPVGEAPRVGEQDVAHPVDPAQQPDLDAADLRRPARASRRRHARQRRRRRRDRSAAAAGGARRSSASAMRRSRAAIRDRSSGSATGWLGKGRGRYHVACVAGNARNPRHCSLTRHRVPLPLPRGRSVRRRRRARLLATARRMISRLDADADLHRLCPGNRLVGLLGNQSTLIQFLPLVLIFVVFYFLLIRPQQRKAKDHRATLDALRRGDRVVTGGGIIGTVVRADSPDEVGCRHRRGRAGARRAQHDQQRARQARSGCCARGGQAKGTGAGQGRNQGVSGGARGTPVVGRAQSGWLADRRASPARSRAAGC